MIISIILFGACTAGNRYVIVTDCMWVTDIAKVLSEEFKPLGKF